MNTKPHEKLLHKDVSYLIQGCCFEIRKEYGAGQKESVYVNLLKECLESKGLTVEKEKSIKIYSSKSGKIVGSYRPDIVVNNKIPIEVKSSTFTTKQDERQLYHYLRNSKYELGYLVNFSTKKLFLKRIIYTNDRKPFLKIFSCAFVFFFVFFSVLSEAKAAELFFEPKTQEIRTGDFFQVDLFLDAQEEEINAVEGKIVFPEDLLEIKEILDGDSIINFWAEKPHLENSQIVFSGIIPGGFKGVLSPYYEGFRPGKILSLIFRARETNAEQDAEPTQSGLIEIKDAKVLLNDGLGTEAKFSISNFQFSITSEAPQVVGLLPIKDPDPPEPFEIIIAQDPNVFDGKWFLVFNAQDKGSGIDYYAIDESRRKKEATRINTKDWTKGESPYLLKDQKLRSYIYVKAVDKAGNERTAELPPRNPLRWYENSLFWAIIILGILVIYLVRRILWTRYTKRH